MWEWYLDILGWILKLISPVSFYLYKLHYWIILNYIPAHILFLMNIADIISQMGKCIPNIVHYLPSLKFVFYCIQYNLIFFFLRVLESGKDGEHRSPPQLFILLCSCGKIQRMLALLSYRLGFTSQPNNFVAIHKAM